jgi:hypothetical protein
MINQAMIATAAKVFAISEDQAETNSADIPDQDLSRFWSPVRGGGGIIIGADLTYLLYGPQATTQQAIEAYLSGLRTEDE